MAAHITAILDGCPSIEALKETLGDAAKQLPDPVNLKATVGAALSGMPAKLSRIIHEPGHRPCRGVRPRPPRPRRSKPVQRRLSFMEPAECEKIRKEFIEICRHIVLDAAIAYHLFLV